MTDAPDRENDDHMDIIRNLLYKGVDPEVLIARGASPEHVMAVCREIIQGTRERNDSAEQETPDVDYSREASMAHARESSIITAPSSENVVDDEMLGESPESDVIVEPHAYRLDSAQLLNPASAEPPRPEVVRLPEPHFSTPVLSPPSLLTVRTVGGVPVESGPRPHLESILAPSPSVPDILPTCTFSSSGDEPAQSVQPALSTQPTGLASLPPRPISLLPPSGSPPRSPVPLVQPPISSSPANEQQPSKKKKKKKKKGTQEEASANAAINASIEAGPGPSTMASQAISQTSQAAQPRPPQPSQPHPHPPPPAKPRKMTKKEKKAARAQAAAAAAAASTSTSVSGPMGLPPRPVVYSETYHTAPPYVPDPYAMYPAHLQPQIQPHFQPPYQPQRPPQPSLPQAFQQPPMFDMNGRVPLTPLAQRQPPPPPTAAPPLPPGSPPVDLQTVLSETKRKVLESMRRRKEASLQPSAPVTPALETPVLETPALTSTHGSIGTGTLNRSVQEEAAALEREFLGMHMSAASMAGHAGPKSTTQSGSISMEMDVDVDMDIDEPEEGEILVVSPRLSTAPAVPAVHALTPAPAPPPAPALTSTLSTSVTLPERPASAGSNLPVVRRGIKRAHAEDLNESRTVSAPAARPPPAAKRLFCAPLRPHQLKISLDEDSESDDNDSDDEDDEEKRRIEADEKQRKLAEEIARLKAQIAMKKRRKLQSGQASEAATPTSTDMGSNADMDVQEASTPQDQGNLNLVKSAVIQSIGKPRDEGLIRCKSKVLFLKSNL